MKRILRNTTVPLLLVFLASGCGTAQSGIQETVGTSAVGTELSVTEDIFEEPEQEKEETPFDKYISNTYISTGNNQYIESADGVTYRAYFPAEEYGKHEYCFYFSNRVDSTYDNGERAYVGRDGGEYKIENAFIADGGNGPDDEISNRTAVTFDGKSEKTVTKNETYWSDPVDFELADGHFIVWEWKVTGSGIPCTNMSYLTSAAADNGSGKFDTCDEIPLPQLIGCDRDFKHYISAIGDSITQGCQTGFMAYEYWAARISQKLGSDYGFYNCGLGWSRASDAMISENWIERVSAGQTVIVAFGTNDIASGQYGSDGGNSAYEIDGFLRSVIDQLRAKGCDVVLFNSPPENFGKTQENVRSELNGLLRLTAKEYGIKFFDFAGLLCSEDEPQAALYGPHPNGEGGDIVSDEFIKQFGKNFGA